MRTSLNVLQNLQVASPCHADWNEMAGDDRSRFCGQCEKHVYNLSAMTAQEAIDLVREKEGNLCARFYRRQDGTMLTADCLVGAHHRIQRRHRTAGVLASVASLLFITGCEGDKNAGGKPNESVLTQWWNQLVENPEKKRIVMGVIAPLPVTGEVCIPKGPEPDPSEPAKE